MARLILWLALLLSAEWVTCQSDLLQPEVQLLIATQDALLKRLDLLEAKLLEQNVVQTQLQDQVRSLQNENAKLINSVAALEKKVAACEQKSETETQKLETKAVTGMPTSCLELYVLGHTLNGFYQVQGAGVNANRIETVYCDFEQPPSSIEKRIGYIDHKTSPVYFYVQRETMFPTHDAVLPFQLEILNVGGAMNLTTGTFTAPINGIYHFAFTGYKNSKGCIWIYLRVNGDYISTAGSGCHDNSATLTLHSTLRLQRGDRVDLCTSYSAGGMLYDGILFYQFTHFSGWLLEEDLSFS